MDESDDRKPDPEDVPDEFGLPPDDDDSVMDWLDYVAAMEVKPEEASGEPESDPLGWLDESNEPTPTDELPTMQWRRDKEAQLRAPQDAQKDRGQTDAGFETPEDAMAWLEQLAAGGGAALDEQPTMVNRSSSERDEPAVPQPVPAAPSQSSRQSLPPIDDGSDDPMAWLEQLAVDQDTPLDELPSVADRLLASEIISQVDTSTDVDIDAFGSFVPRGISAVALEAALAHLEQKAQAKGVDIQSVELVQVAEEVDLGEVLDYIDRLAAGELVVKETAVPSEPSAHVEQLPQAPQPTPEPEVAAETPHATPPRAAVDWSELSAGMPEDPDEALAWLEGMSDTAKLSDGDLVALDADADAPVPPADAPRAPMPSETDARVIAATEQLDLDAHFLADMPEDPDEAVRWLEQVAAQQGVALEAAHVADADEEPSLEDLPTDPGLHLRAAMEEAEAQQRTAETRELQRSQAADALAAGNWETAVSTYRTQLDSGDDLPGLISTLEDMVTEFPKVPKLRRVLGDAYMRNGQLDEAVAAYQHALDHL